MARDVNAQLHQVNVEGDVCSYSCFFPTSTTKKGPGAFLAE